MNRTDDSQNDLQISEIRYRRLFETSPDGILILDAETRKITDANPFMTGLLGCSREELLDKELWEIGLFKERNESRAAFLELLEKGCLRYKNLPLETKTGSLREVEFISNLYLEESRRVIQCSIRDITRRRKEEDKLEQQAQNAAMLTQIAGKVACLGGWTIQLPERILSWSDENCIIHDVPPGYKPTLEEGIGYFPPEYREKVVYYVEECAKNGTPYDFELPKYTAKGRLIWVRSIGEAVRDAEGKIIGLQGAFQDITIRKEAEEEREKLIKELRDALAEVKTLREFLPICSYCRKVRDDRDYWSQIENYISDNTHTKFSHSICPDCYETEVTPQLQKLKQQQSLSDS